ncbi:protein dachsous-like [Tropilaelaps mercedesae]|uniref:Protein dachsous-like n=1 Tax=Tropilaelaps mercedesae TaxID=418985 RepID=A0A1V9XA04_9ACAR|nr:protein dachsous-like [Tropilaelaps mercedesae]
MAAGLNDRHVREVRQGRRRLATMGQTGPLLLLLAAGLTVGPGSAGAEYLQEFEVRENVPLGTVIGYIGQPKSEGQMPPPAPPYYVVPVANSDVDCDLVVVPTTGEIRTNTTLDRETRAEYSFTAIPVTMGENVRVVIRVLDENDNPPTFPASFIRIEFAENAPRDAKRTLAPARDRDLGRFNTQRYEIISGNTNNAFKLSYHRERDEVLYLDLQVNGVLDREITSAYSLIVEAFDGGAPALKGTLQVNITIQDVNDNQPIFSQGRYVATIPENATVGTSVLRVFATDTDAGRNGEVRYTISRRQSDREQFFTIDAKSGEVFVNKPLDFETKDVHELVVVAKDNGAQPLETTTFVSIRVTDVNDNTPTISLIFLSDDTSPRISEDAKVGDFIGRISVSDPDSREEYANINVTLHGGDGHFGLTTRDSVIYLVVVRAPLDREQQANFTMTIMATDQGVPPLNASTVFVLVVTDVNDNPPVFAQAEYSVNMPEIAEPGYSVVQLRAIDRDAGENAEVRYELRHDPSGWFKLDPVTGLLTTKTYVDCETNPNPVLVVIARDRGTPALSASAKVSVTVSDVNDNEPLFDQSYYNVTVAEDTAPGSCIIKAQEETFNAPVEPLAVRRRFLNEASLTTLRRLLIEGERRTKELFCPWPPFFRWATRAYECSNCHFGTGVVDRTKQKPIMGSTPTHFVDWMAPRSGIREVQK